MKPVDMLNDWEKRLCEAVAGGAAVDFSTERDAFKTGQGAEPVVRALVLRRLLLGLRPSNDCFEPRLITPAGLKLRAARIEGRLDLDGLSWSDGRPLPPLSFRECVFDNGFSAEHAHLWSLSLEGSRFDSAATLNGEPLPQVHLAGAQVEGNLDLSRAGPIEENGLCWVHAINLRVDGDIIAGNAFFRSPPPRPQVPPGDLPRYALNLRGAEISGEIMLYPNVVAEGGVNLRDAEVRENVWMMGGQVTKREDHAFNAQSVTIRAALGLGIRFEENVEPKRFTAQGRVFLMGANIGNLNMTGATLSAKGDAALDLTNATIQQDVLLVAWFDNKEKERVVPFDAKGWIHASGIKIGGLLYMSGARLDGNPALVLRNADIQQDVLLSKDGGHPCDVQGRIDMEGTQIGGSLHLSGLFFNPLRGSKILWLKDTVIKRNLQIAAPNVNIDRKSIKLRKDIHNATIQQARTTPLSCYPGFAVVEALVAIDVKVGDGHGQSEESSKKSSWIGYLTNAQIGTRFLDGRSNVFHQLNREQRLRLENDEQALEYLRLFCAFTWGEAGPFSIVENTSQLPSGISIPENVSLKPPGITKKEDEYWEVNAYVLYSATLFQSTFKIERSGMISMKDDKFVLSLGPKQLSSYEAPFRRDPDLGDTSSSREPFRAQWREIEPEERQKVESEIHHLNVGSPPEANLGNAVVNLRNATCGALEDNDGAGWGDEVSFDLQNFTYRGIPENLSNSETRSFFHKMETLRRRATFEACDWLSRRFRWAQRNARLQRFLDENIHSLQPWQKRKQWLKRQYGDHLPTPETYFPQPYSQLARVLRSQGEFSAARHIEAAQLFIEGRLKAQRWFWPFSWLLRVFDFSFWLGFRYGLSGWRAFLTCLLFWCLGWWGTEVALDKGMLVIDTTPVASVAVQAPGNAEPAPATRVADPTQARNNIPCGDEITPALYAADVFIPLLDFRQEERCAIRAKPVPTLLPSLPQFTIEDVPKIEQQAPLLPDKRTTGHETDPTPSPEQLLHDPWIWHWMKAGYAALGWLVVSLSILTFSGVLRHNIERQDT